MFGHDLADEPRLAKQMVGFVPQELVNHGFFSIEEIMNFHSGYYGIGKNKERIDYLLHRLSLYEHKDKRVKQLSGGMKRRLSIAKSLVHSPKLLLLDEPTAGVDIELRASLWEFVEDLKKDGVTILLTTHYLEEAESLCDRVGFLQQGQLVKVGQTKALIQDLTSREVIIKVGKMKHNISHPLLVNQTSDELVFKIPSEMNLGTLLSEAKIEMAQLEDVRIQEGSLEDAFRTVMAEGRS